MAFWSAASFGLSAVGFLSGRSARKRQAREQRRLTAASLTQESYELGRTERARAAEERSMFAAAGVDPSSGSPMGVEEGRMREAVYQQEAILAGLPRGYKGKNPFAALGSRKKRTFVNTFMDRQMNGDSGRNLVFQRLRDRPERYDGGASVRRV